MPVFVYLHSHYLFNGILLASHLSHLGDNSYMILQLHLKALGKGEVGLGSDWEAQVIGQLLPVAVPHARVPQALDQWDVGPE